MSEGNARLEALVRQYSRLVRAVAGRVGGAKGREIAEDVEQRVFLSLWKQVSREQTILNPASYIYRCAVRETIRLLNGDRRDEQALDQQVVETVQSPAMGPDDRLAARERALAMAEVLRTLAPDRRRAVQAYLAGFSVAETMGMYGWSYQRARNLVARGLADLRTALHERGING
jgi:RNA polymerase sigma factor (sigma-70 family)